MVVAVAGDSAVQTPADLPDGVRVSSEYPELTRGATSPSSASRPTSACRTGRARPRSRTSPTVSSRSPRRGGRCGAAGLRIIDTILVSYTEVIANRDAHEDAAKRHAMGQLMTLLNGTLEAREKVLLKINVAADCFEAVLQVLPSAKSPTVSELAGGGYAVESLVEKRSINLIIPALKDAGATDLLEIPIAKIVH